MIRKVKFNNFYSFKEEQIIDFTTTKKTSLNYFQALDGRQITKVAGFAGPNASGKTNIMKIFGFLHYFLSIPERDSQSDLGVGFKSYAFCKQKPSSFYLEFETETKIYFYSLEATPAKVIRESLEARKLQKNARKYNVFARNGEEIDLNKNVVAGVTSKVLSSIRDDVSVVAFLNANYDISEINEISNYFRAFATNVNEAGITFSPEDRIGFAASTYNKNPKLKERMEEFLKGSDLGIEGFSIKKEEDDLISVSAVHEVENKPYKLPIGYESRGTKSLFVELLHIANTIEAGTVLVLDEIETGLHPEAVDKLIQFIADAFSDQKKQFIFTSHSLNYLKRYDSQQIYFVEKNDNKSSVFRLDDLDVRSDENHFAKYMSGSYGAFPKIRV